MLMPKTATIGGNWVSVSFSGIEGRLTAQGGAYGLGVELCGTDPNSCHFVLPRLDGNRMVIEVPAEMQPSRVRQAWSDAPVVNLYDEGGMPVPGFELEITR